MSSWCFRNPRKTVAAWIVVVAVALATAGAWWAPRSWRTCRRRSRIAAEGFEALEEHFEGLGGGFSGSIVFRSESGIDDPAVRAAMEEMFEEVASYEGVTLTSPYLATVPIPETAVTAHTSPAAHGRGARRSARMASLRSRGSTSPRSSTSTTRRPLAASSIDIIPDVPGLQVEIGGEALSEFVPPQSEFIGLAFAIVVLILAFGSVMAMGLPIAVAGAGVGLGLSLAVILSNTLSIPEFATTIGAMVGIGVGIDYALFIVTRYRDGLAEDGRRGAVRLRRIRHGGAGSDLRRPDGGDLAPWDAAHGASRSSPASRSRQQSPLRRR